MTPTLDTPAAEAPKIRAPRAPRRAASPAANPSETVTLTRAQLEELMSRVTGTDVSRSAPVTNGDFLTAVQAIIKESRPAEKITVANRVAFNPMNPDNTPRKWKAPFFQNWEPVEAEDVTPLEYELIPQLKSGLFIKSRKGIPLVEVIVVKRGSQRGIHLRYDNSRADKSIELMTYAPSLEIMLQKCVAEYKAQQDALAKRRAAGLPDDADED